MTKVEAQKRISLVWFVGAGLLFLTLVLQSIMGRYGTQVDAAWGWFLPTVMPSLSLIIGVLVSEARGLIQGSAAINVFVFRIAVWLSAGYLVLVALTILLVPFTSESAVTLMTKSNLWLGPAQGLVSAALGAFFVSKSSGAKQRPLPAGQ